MTEIETHSAEELIGPPKTDLPSVGLSSLAAAISGMVGGVFILVCTFLFLNSTKASPGIFPYVFSLVGFFAILISTYLGLFFSRMIFPDKYRGDAMTSFGQTFAFSIILYLIITPLYVYIGGADSAGENRIIYVFVLHLLVSSLGVSLITEILSSYRYILLSLYGTFIGFIGTVAISVVFFQNFSTSDATLYSLIAIIIVVDLVTAFLHRTFEYLYLLFYRSTGLDPLGDVFSRIENEERLAMKRAEQKLTTFQ